MEVKHRTMGSRLTGLARYILSTEAYSYILNQTDNRQLVKKLDYFLVLSIKNLRKIL